LAAVVFVVPGPFEPRPGGSMDGWLSRAASSRGELILGRTASARNTLGPRGGARASNWTRGARFCGWPLSRPRGVWARESRGGKPSEVSAPAVHRDFWARWDMVASDQRRTILGGRGGAWPAGTLPRAGASPRAGHSRRAVICSVYVAVVSSDSCRGRVPALNRGGTVEGVSAATSLNGQPAEGGIYSSER